MERPLALVLLSLALYCCTPESADQVEDTTLQQYTIEQFLDNETIFGGSFSPDDQSLLFTSSRSGIFNLYRMPVSGGNAEPLTQSDTSSIFAISYFPNDDRILFRMDDNGNEIWHLYVRDESGEVKELTPGEKARAEFYGWSRDGKSFFYGFTKRDPRFADFYKMDIESFESTLIYQNDAGLMFGGLSGDEKYMALVKPINTNDTDLFLYHFDTGEMDKVSENLASYSPADFSTDNQAFYYLTNDGAEFQYLAKYDIATKERRKTLQEEWDISYAYFSHNGKYQVVGINEDGKTIIKVFDTASGSQIDFPEFGNGDITSVGISRSEQLMRFYVGSSAAPSNLHVYDFSAGEHKQLTNTLNSNISPKDLVEATVVRFPSFDGLEIPAIYYKPKQASQDNKVSALVWVHGGPGGQSRQSYSALIQYLVNHGYAILAVNNRGSSGYGKTFFQMDDQNHGEKDLQDCIYGKNWLAQQDYINPEKIGIIGGSYGGFMTMAAMTTEPDEFEVGVDIFGVTNWLRTLKNIPPWWEPFKDALYKEMGDPYQDSVRLHRISPLFHADQIKKPVMVLQGAQDPRVLQVESDEIVEAVKANGIPVEYVVFEDEGHGFVKKENQIEAYGQILTFLDKYLGKKEELMN